MLVARRNPMTEPTTRGLDPAWVAAQLADELDRGLLDQDDSTAARIDGDRERLQLCDRRGDRLLTTFVRFEIDGRVGV